MKRKECASMASTQVLPFEKDIVALEELLAKLEAKHEPDAASAEQIRSMRRELLGLTRKVYSDLTAWDTVLVSRHPNRPQTCDYVNMIFSDFVELHGDRAFGDDRAIRAGFARIGDHRVMLIGHQKGHNLRERNECLYGCAHPEGYRKALRCMKLAAKYRLPVICLIDTPGAYPGIGAEERGQAQLIATSLLEMSRISTPIICIVIGEGGSGGALGIGIGDRVAMLEFAYYSVISPEGCAGILWKEANDQTKRLAAEALKLTSKDLFRLKVIDHIIAEPLGGAHRDPVAMGSRLREYLERYLRDLVGLSVDSLLDARYRKFREMGVFDEGIAESEQGRQPG
jgi:acetyl-CoA carboxylase carboxyl transferase subunit alpha